MEESTLTVSALNEYVRRSLAADPMLRFVRLRGEVSNFKQHFSGHWYFSLKDEGARIACVMFRQHNLNVRFVPAEGMRVVLSGAVGLYTASGSYQFYAEGMQKDGTGQLYERLLKLKEKLTEEGLFDLSRKRPLPLLPAAVGIVTSRTGAVLYDVVTVARRRSPFVPLILRAAQVQGELAADDLVRGLNELAAYPGIEVIIIGRGGGSMEDLWAFNEEKVVRAIAACPIPVVSAVGHETDVTLADLAADVRAATPSQAAELAVPDRAMLKEKLRRAALSLATAGERGILDRRDRLHRSRQELEKRTPALTIEALRSRTELYGIRLRTAMSRCLERKRDTLLGMRTHLDALGPEATMRRGYALVMDGARIVSSVKDAPEHMTIRFKDGRIAVTRSGKDNDGQAEGNI